MADHTADVEPLLAPEAVRARVAGREVQLSWHDDDGHYDSIDAHVSDAVLTVLIDHFLALNRQ